MPSVTLKTVKDYSDAAGNAIIGSATGKVVIEFNSKGCTLKVASGVKIRGEILFNAPNATIEIGRNSQFHGKMQPGLDCRISIGARLSVTQHCYISVAEGGTVTIGDDCMFASWNQIRADDGHAIFDRKTGARLNPCKSISIGNKVWLGYDAAVLAGGEIGDGTVIGFRSLVKSKIPAGCVAAGSPARVLREDIVWERPFINKRPPYFFPDRPPK